ncbi:MAG TPA: FAD-dependent oxidoreductase, partial [Terrimicrobiaceae bacterium]|nr:FAD-dependent oxidoreductase [Terrimicrobiaceae bacterium]
CLNRKDGVAMRDGKIQKITMENGDEYSARYFIDATYEGDLMAAAGVDYIVGREPVERYGEAMNGVRTGDRVSMAGISPYVVDGKPESGLLPRVEPKPPGEPGAGDHRTQAYNFRMCLTNVPENRVPFEKPADYNPLEYEILLRMLVKKGRPIIPFKLTPMPNGKTDSNNALYISTDYIGGSYQWPEATYAEREKILAAHRTYVQGFFWFLQNDPRVPQGVRELAAPWGLAKDEFADNGNWPTQLYVREARRMVGEHVMKQDNFSAKEKADPERKNPLPAVPKEPVADPVAVGSYALDSHTVSMFTDETGGLFLEGNYSGGPRPYGISYRSLLPKAGQCTNLLVPICLSSSHVAYGSIRMEPVYMELGQAAATAACLALDEQTTPQKLRYPLLRERLLADGAVLDPDALPTLKKK